MKYFISFLMLVSTLHANSLDDMYASAKALNVKAQNYKQQVQELVQPVNSQLLKSVKSDNESKVIVFASFSMPNSALASLVKQANQYKVPVVLIGLYKNSYPATVQKIKYVLAYQGLSAPVGGFLIDPSWFELYQIDKVPAFVITSQLARCTDNNLKQCNIHKFDVLYGNLNVKSALDIFSKKSQFQDLARTYLKEAHND